MYDEIRIGDVVRMRKPHPCGSFQWEVVRLGADIGIRCTRCGRRVLMPRSRFIRQVKALVQRSTSAEEAATAALPHDSRAAHDDIKNT
jgi:hypothetical protein